MIHTIDTYMNNFEKNIDPGIGDLIENLEKELDFQLPESYLDIIKKYRGGNEEVDGNRFLDLFPIGELIEINKDYNFVMDQIPDFFLFAKDSADTGYAINKKNGCYYGFGLMSNFARDPIEFYGCTFLEFLKSSCDQ